MIDTLLAGFLIFCLYAMGLLALLAMLRAGLS